MNTDKHGSEAKRVKKCVEAVWKDTDTTVRLEVEVPVTARLEAGAMLDAFRDSLAYGTRKPDHVRTFDVPEQRSDAAEQVVCDLVVLKAAAIRLRDAVQKHHVGMYERSQDCEVCRALNEIDAALSPIKPQSPEGE